jgi:hypothetical protein
MTTCPYCEQFFFSQFVWIWCQSHFALFCCKEICIPNNFHYRKRDASTQLLHCRIHTGNFVFIGKFKIIQRSLSMLENVCFDFYFSLSTVKHQHKSKQGLQTTHFFFEAGCYSEVQFWRNFLFFKLPRPAPGPTQSSNQSILGVLSSGVEVCHAVPFSHTLSVTSLCPKWMSPSLLACATDIKELADWPSPEV